MSKYYTSRALIRDSRLRSRFAKRAFEVAVRFMQKLRFKEKFSKLLTKIALLSLFVFHLAF